MYIGAHKREEIKSLILKLSLTMNNFRLSTYSGKVELLSERERYTLRKAYEVPTIKHLSDGRQIDIFSGKIVHQNTSSIYEIIRPNNETVLNQTLSEAAQTVGVNIKTLSKHLDLSSSNNN